MGDEADPSMLHEAVELLDRVEEPLRQEALLHRPDKQTHWRYHVLRAKVHGTFTQENAPDLPIHLSLSVAHQAYVLTARSRRRRCW
ncbi:hypothetical protein [Streptomyces sp. NPDC088246]|uniref:hypothetical protein n=1 Tax=Streptomyces sp. NPDC088246 TaxID=3365842 RepID=UPI00381C3D6F